MSQVCSNATCVGCPPTRVLSLNSTVMSTLPSGLSRLPPATCEQSGIGYDDIWTITVASPTTVTLETGGALDTVLFVRSACGASTDLACNDDTPGINLLSRVTMTMQPGTYFVVVKEYGTGNFGGDYTLTATAATTNASCGAPTVLQPGVVVSQDSSQGVTPGNTCVAAGGGQLFYELDVPPGMRGTVTVTPAGMASLTSLARTSCTATTCLSTGQGVGPQLHTIANTGSVMVPLIVSVAATTAGANGPFTVTAALQPVSLPPYAMSTIMAVCDDLTTQPDVLGATTTPRLSDDVTTSPLPLPFPFSYFRQPVTHYSLTSNGFAQLHASASGPASNSFQNQPMPTLNAPNSLVAALWTDLVPGGATAHVRTLVSGSPPNRVATAEWTDFAFFQNGIGPERLQFQVKIYETTNVLEFHYCTMQLNGGSQNRLTGETATVGLENQSGNEAAQFSHRTANMVFQGMGVRFVPQ